MSTFEERFSVLAEIVGDGDLAGSVEYDQAYAQNQHETLNFKHLQGGQAKFLETVIQGEFERYLERIAKDMLEDGGKEGMIDSMEDLAQRSSQLAPVGPAPRGKTQPLHPGLLRDSAHPVVKDGNSIIYDRPGAPRQQEHDVTPGDRRGNRGRVGG